MQVFQKLVTFIKCLKASQSGGPSQLGNSAWASPARQCSPWRQAGPSFTPGHGVSPGGFLRRRQPQNAHFLGGSCLQTLVDRVLKPRLLPCCRDTAAPGFIMYNYVHVGRQLAPQARCILMGRQLGGANGEHTSPRPSPPQHASGHLPRVGGVC